MTRRLTIENQQTYDLFSKNPANIIQNKNIQIVTYQTIHFLKDWCFICIHYTDYKSKPKKLSLWCDLLKGSAQEHMDKIIQSYKNIGIPTTSRDVKILDWVFNDGEALDQWLRMTLVSIISLTLLSGAYTVWIYINYIISTTLGWIILLYLFAIPCGIAVIFLLLNRLLLSKKINTKTITALSVFPPLLFLCTIINYNYINSTPATAEFHYDQSSRSPHQDWFFQDYSLDLRGYQKPSQTSHTLPIQQGENGMIFIEKTEFSARFKPE